MTETPVLFLIFNRPQYVELVFNEIRKAQPGTLYVHADGPRAGEEEDRGKCSAARKIIENGIDWDCELHTLFRDDNLGCGKGPASAMTWFFSHVDEGIILEDDCLPHPDFFGYCSELLARYRNDERIMIIGATTYHDDYPCEFSYTFTRYGTMAAWATWKRAWEKFDYTLSFTDRKELKRRMKRIFSSSFEVNNWLGLYDWISADGFSSYWDWQMHFALFFHGGIAIRPKINLVSNIGAGPDATHTTYVSAPSFEAFRPTESILPLCHPESVAVDKKADSVYYKKMHQQSLSKRIRIFIFRRLFTGKESGTAKRSWILEFYRNVKFQIPRRK